MRIYSIIVIGIFMLIALAQMLTGYLAYENIIGIGLFTPVLVYLIKNE